MALSDVIKKKQATGDGSEKEKAAKKNLLDDVRVVIAVLIVACIGLVVLTVFGAKGIDETEANIEKAKAQYKQNQLAIANLKALQARSGEYKDQIAQYDILKRTLRHIIAVLQSLPSASLRKMSRTSIK